MVGVIQEEEKPYKMKRVDQDGLWKKIIGELFEEFLLFFMPTLHAEVDFKQKVEFLDNELFQEVVDEKKGRRYVDRLAKVRLKNGTEKWVLVHVEVQSSPESDFSKRMFQYFYRIFDRYDEEVVAMAVYTFPGNVTDMMHFQYDYFGTTVHYAYNNYKVADYSDEELLASSNIFSRVVFAAKAMHLTENEVEKRYRFKQKLMRELIRSKKYSSTSIVAVIHFIDYLLQLPEEETNRMSKVIGPEIRKERGIMKHYNEDNASPSIKPSMLDLWDGGVKEGREEGRIQTLIDLAHKMLMTRYGDIPSDVSETIQNSDVNVLNDFILTVFEIEDMDDVREFFNK